MSIEILGLRNCDTCRKALKALPGAVLRDVREQPLSADEIAALLTEFPDKLLNRASTTWRGLPEDDRAQPAADLLAAYPTLMKRPVLRAPGALHIGWTPAVRAALGVE